MQNKDLDKNGGENLSRRRNEMADELRELESTHERKLRRMESEHAAEVRSQERKHEDEEEDNYPAVRLWLSSPAFLIVAIPAR